MQCEVNKKTDLPRKQNDSRVLMTETSIKGKFCKTRTAVSCRLDDGSSPVLRWSTRMSNYIHECCLGHLCSVAHDVLEGVAMVLLSLCQRHCQRLQTKRHRAPTVLGHRGM